MSHPHGTPRVVNGTKDVLLKFHGKQLDSESSLMNARRMYSPALGRFLPTRTASVPSKPSRQKAVPPPQSLNATSPGTNNTVANPSNLLGSIGGILGFLSQPTPGSEQNCTCCEYGCFPGPPDIICFFGTGLQNWTCSSTNTSPGILGVCNYVCRGDDGTVSDAPFTLRNINHQCKRSSNVCPQGLEIEAFDIDFSPTIKKCIESKQ